MLTTRMVMAQKKQKRWEWGTAAPGGFASADAVNCKGQGVVAAGTTGVSRRDNGGFPIGPRGYAEGTSIPIYYSAVFARLN